MSGALPPFEGLGTAPLWLLLGGSPPHSDGWWSHTIPIARDSLSAAWSSEVDQAGQGRLPGRGRCPLSLSIGAHHCFLELQGSGGESSVLPIVSATSAHASTTL